ncbi:MAG TPA: L,D-transpeptidase [Gammaproteobacteria bacterium]|nr:L,D-transpeptidase [Gammaproteobacteria bacterium]
MYTIWKYITLSFLLIPVIAYSGMPASVPAIGEKQIIVDPHKHRWGAYDEDGNLVKTGMATAGGNWCPDIRQHCRTRVGTFRIDSLGERSCKSRKFPRPRGGAPMPYCMFFNGGQALHGSNSVFDGNGSHGCVRLHVQDARWLRFNFAEEPNRSNEGVGTLVVVKPY